MLNSYRVRIRRKFAQSMRTPAGNDKDAKAGIGTHATCGHVRFSNRPTEVKRFQTIRRHGVGVARGLALLFGIGTMALRKFRRLPGFQPATNW
jgi:hypothetical protein